MMHHTTMPPCTKGRRRSPGCLRAIARRRRAVFVGGKQGEIGVAEREALEDVVRRGRDVDVVAGAIKNGFAIAGGLDGNGLVRGLFALLTNCHAASERPAWVLTTWRSC